LTEIEIIYDFEGNQVVSMGPNKTPYLQDHIWNVIYSNRDKNRLYLFASNQMAFESLLVIDEEFYFTQMKQTDKDVLDNSVINKWMKKVHKVIPLFQQMGITNHVHLIFMTNADTIWKFEETISNVPLNVITKGQLEAITHINRTQK